MARSLWIYRRPGRLAGLLKLYRPFVPEHGLVFDIGAHLGDRTRAFRHLGARVIALEPQPQLMTWLRRFHGKDSGVTLIQQAVGAQSGKASLSLSPFHPAVATLDANWRTEVQRGHPGFANVTWNTKIETKVTTLDALINEHGRPDFCKIDVEGFEAEVLSALSQSLDAISVEFVRGSLHRTRACVDRLEALDHYRYNAVPGEQRDMVWSRWRNADETRAWLEAGADQIASGDLFARRAKLIPLCP